MDEQNSGVYAPQIIEFVAVADQYCKHLERESGYKPTEFLAIMQRILPMLYARAVNLPSLEPVFEEGNEHYVSEADWNAIDQSISSKLGMMNTFEEPFDQTLHGSGEPAAGAVSEYLADIYQYVKDFLMQYGAGTEEVMNDAVWECSTHFETTWGTKLLSSLRAIHKIAYSGTPVDSLAETSGKSVADDAKGKDSWFISRRQEEYGEDD
jgi:hypothetical protein